MRLAGDDGATGVGARQLTALVLTNPKVQRLRRLLGRRSARQDDGAFVIEGPTLVCEAIDAGLDLEAVFVGPDGSVDRDVAVPTYEVAPGVMERIASTVSPQPVLAVARWCDVAVDAIAAQPGFVVVCAGLADPGNAGTILRSAEASGAGGVVLTVGSVDVFNPKVVRASAGALFHVPVAVDVPFGVLKKLDRPRFGAAARDGIPYDEAPLDEPCALVFGSESHGLPDGLALDGLISIPHVGRAESLNVAMAATVLCFEAARRRR